MTLKEAAINIGISKRTANKISENFSKYEYRTESMGIFFKIKEFVNKNGTKIVDESIKFDTYKYDKFTITFYNFEKVYYISIKE